MKHFIWIFFICIGCGDTQKLSNSFSTDKAWKDRPYQRKGNIDRLNKSLEWIEIKPNLWKNVNGELGIKTIEVDEKENTIDRFITQLCCEGKTLNSTIDISTFKFIGSSFYKDKNHIYTHYIMADGGNFWIVESADVETFEVIGDCYAKDKNHIFGERQMVMDSVDYQTFKTIEGYGCYAKDKNGYYFWDDKIPAEHLKDSLIQAIFSKF